MPNVENQNLSKYFKKRTILTQETSAVEELAEQPREERRAKEGKGAMVIT
jgi:hypothetical protein